MKYLLIILLFFVSCNYNNSRLISGIGHSYGESMEPTFYEGDQFLIEPTSYRDLKIGDIIVFKRNKKLISHRIIDIRSGKYITRGDNNVYEDDPILREEYRGRVTMLIKLKN